MWYYIGRVIKSETSWECKLTIFSSLSHHVLKKGQFNEIIFSHHSNCLTLRIFYRHALIITGDYNSIKRPFFNLWFCEVRRLPRMLSHRNNNNNNTSFSFFLIIIYLLNNSTSTRSASFYIPVRLIMLPFGLFHLVFFYFLYAE